MSSVEFRLRSISVLKPGLSQPRGDSGAMNTSPAKASLVLDRNSESVSTSSAISVWRSVGPGTPPLYSGVPKTSHDTERAGRSSLILARKAARSCEGVWSAFVTLHPANEIRNARTRISGFKGDSLIFDYWRAADSDRSVLPILLQSLNPHRSMKSAALPDRSWYTALPAR